MEKTLHPIEIGFIETIRVNRSKLNIRILRFTGKEGKHFVCISPSVFVSGYGKTKNEAWESFDTNMQLFCEDLMQLSTNEREKELRKLGFKKERLKHKNFSKAYVDENGVLQNFEEGTLETKVLEATTCS